MVVLDANEIIGLRGIDRRPTRAGLMPDLLSRAMSDFRGEMGDLRDDTDSLSSGVEIEPWDDAQVKNVGVDVRLGGDVWASDTLTRVNETNARSFLENATHHEIGDSFVCQPDPKGQKIYYFLTHERIRTSPLIDYKVDSKSTTGRVGCMSHQASNGNVFDGRILIALQPYVFPIRVIPGKTSVSQVIFRFAGTPTMTQTEIRKTWGEEVGFYRDKELVPLEEILRPGGLEMTFSTERAYRAKNTGEPIDLTKLEHYAGEDFFEELDGNNQLTLEPYRFYLFGTRETVSLGKICGELSRENSNVGTGLWSHFAGFFMPGFSGGITLECWSPVRRIIHHGDPAGLVTLDRVRTNNAIEFKSPYQNQKAPRLPKMFKVS